MGGCCVCVVEGGGLEDVEACVRVLVVVLKMGEVEEFVQCLDLYELGSSICSVRGLLMTHFYGDLDGAKDGYQPVLIRPVLPTLRGLSLAQLLYHRSRRWVHYGFDLWRSVKANSTSGKRSLIDELRWRFVASQERDHRLDDVLRPAADKAHVLILRL